LNTHLHSGTQLQVPLSPAMFSSLFGRDCRSRCERCPAAMRDMLGETAPMPPPEAYPVVGEECRSLGYVTSTFASTMGERSSGEFGTLIPTGARALGPGGEVEIVASKVHLKGNRGVSAASGPSCSASRYSPNEPTVCSICCDNEANCSFECGVHVYCEECVRRHCQEKLSNKLTPTCPAPECKAEADMETMQRLLSAKDFERYLLSTLRATQRLQTCPAPGCGATVYLEEALAEQLAEKRKQRGRDEPGLETAVRCPACSKHLCLVCGQRAHPKYTCEKARQGRLARQPEASAAAAVVSVDGMVIKRCPRCTVSIMKANDDDCDHMICTNCRKEFCWQCFADREVIYEHGNHYHKRSCKFFAAFGGAPQYMPKRCKQCAKRGKACLPP